MRHETHSDVVDLLKQLGLTEYEAQVFAALTRISHGTAREVSELADVPRTRVYDAGDRLADRGLVEIRRSNPQHYRAIPVADAVDVLRRQYDARFEELADALAELEADDEPAGRQRGVWSLSGSETVANRAVELVDGADEEVVALLDRSIRSFDADPVVDRLRAAADRGVAVYAGSLASDEERRAELRAAVPGADPPGALETWLGASDEEGGIGYLVVADRQELLLSSVADDRSDETALRSTDSDDGLLALVRRLLDAGLS